MKNDFTAKRNAVLYSVANNLVDVEFVGLVGMAVFFFSHDFDTMNAQGLLKYANALPISRKVTSQ
jgi:hypothetical protein